MKQKTAQLPDTIAGFERWVSMAEFHRISTLSLDSIRRRAGKDLPPLYSLTVGRKAMRVRDVRAWEEAVARGTEERPWLKAS
jgi:hypothetical protein